jgi:hypothetical protein
MTSELGRSGFVAALFAIHPLHVESVAWVSERKDVLSVFFLMLTLLVYLRYARRGGKGNFFAVFVLYALGLLAKPMLVTLPLLLLILDIWPLQRISLFPAQSGGKQAAGSGHGGVLLPVSRALLEKIPLFLLSAASCTVTYFVQAKSGAMGSRAAFPFPLRVGNALVSYVSYLGKTVWPVSLSFFYPFPVDTLQLWHVVAAAIALILTTLLAIWYGKGRLYLPVGWFWYLGTLLPVIGLVQVGEQAMADRYTYFPLIGIFLLVAWGIPDLAQRIRLPRPILPMIALLVITVLALLSWRQTGYWKDSLSLFNHGAQVTGMNWEVQNNLGIAHNNEGMTLLSGGKVDEAVRHFREALLHKPYDVKVRLNLGVALASTGKMEEAIEHFRKAAEIDPRDPAARYDLGNALRYAGRTEEAIHHIIEALRLRPDYREARMLLEDVRKGSAP